MLINHPLLGPRDAAEFVYLGDASLISRPDWQTKNTAEEFYEYQPYLQYDFHTFGLNPKNMHCDTNSFMNNIYLQHHSEFGLDRYHSLGAASYHFMDENNVYINWENIENFLGEEWFMDNGEPIPDKKQFTETHFDYDNRTFSGVLDFAEPENTTVFNN